MSKSQQIETDIQHRSYTCRVCKWESRAVPDPEGDGESPDMVNIWRTAWRHVTKKHWKPEWTTNYTASRIGTVSTIVLTYSHLNK